MSGHAVVRRYPTPGGSSVLVIRHGWRYEWACFGCHAPGGDGLMSVAARWRAWRHSRRCDEKPRT